MLLSVRIHLLIIVLILAGDDGFPPFLVIQIPLNGLLDAVGELGFRQPAQFVVDLGGIDGIAHIMALPVGHIGDQTFGLAVGSMA